MQLCSQTPGFRQFFQGYVECAMWASTDDNGTPLDALDMIELAPETRSRMHDECILFYTSHFKDLCEHGPMARGGHDFWLTRNRHGAGFWDRGTGEVGKRLTDAAHAWGTVDLYIGDDELVYMN